ncbi:MULTISPECIES: hypothetical protein [Pseudomonas]|uniref:hypothetical protein n=1 Tax=Pseudomonas TaxID=286 RepID=UPI000F55B863|nr:MULTISPECIES: hypothetical protein [Pseudomonas]AZF15591.1 hypothetical protein C4J92_2107 [Pseudomonas sp. R3-18-08]AZF26237.1 hypothetical protein C4J90_2064 [Pseudomonas sp. R2-60-08W]AZF31602.1 hypothetical protein C4J89_2127 [Pseudomonas sp. R4-35-07]AZF36877.1 hypothetical protein C4J88_2094 [Pseudomonas sp. R4-39-08]AZF52544.1 hypothetical protein C4J85_2059 [Pseudomonas sp. R4-34-07]
MRSTSPSNIAIPFRRANSLIRNHLDGKVVKGGNADKQVQFLSRADTAARQHYLRNAVGAGSLDSLLGKHNSLKGALDELASNYREAHFSSRANSCYQELSASQLREINDLQRVVIVSAANMPSIAVTLFGELNTFLEDNAGKLKEGISLIASDSKSASLVKSFDALKQSVAKQVRYEEAYGFYADVNKNFGKPAISAYLKNREVSIPTGSVLPEGKIMSQSAAETMADLRRTNTEGKTGGVLDFVSLSEVVKFVMTEVDLRRPLIEKSPKELVGDGGSGTDRSTSAPERRGRNAPGTPGITNSNVQNINISADLLRALAGAANSHEPTAINKKTSEQSVPDESIPAGTDALDMPQDVNDKSNVAELNSLPPPPPPSQSPLNRQSSVSALIKKFDGDRNDTLDRETLNSPEHDKKNDDVELRHKLNPNSPASVLSFGNVTYVPWTDRDFSKRGSIMLDARESLAAILKAVSYSLQVSSADTKNQRHAVNLLKRDLSNFDDTQSLSSASFETLSQMLNSGRMNKFALDLKSGLKSFENNNIKMRRNYENVRQTMEKLQALFAFIE